MVPLELLWQRMLGMGFSSHIVDLVKSLYTKQGAAVRTTQGLTEDFSVERGILQGCIIPLHLFNIYSEVITRNAFDG